MYLARVFPLLLCSFFIIDLRSTVPSNDLRQIKKKTLFFLNVFEIKKTQQQLPETVGLVTFFVFVVSIQGKKEMATNATSEVDFSIIGL